MSKEFDQLIRETIYSRMEGGDACSTTAENLGYSMELLEKEDPVLAASVKKVNEGVNEMLEAIGKQASELNIEFE